MILYTTLSRLLAADVCRNRYDVGILHLPPGYPEDSPIDLLYLVAACGVQDGLWAMRATQVPGRDVVMGACRRFIGAARMREGGVIAQDMIAQAEKFLSRVENGSPKEMSDAACDISRLSAYSTSIAATEKVPPPGGSINVMFEAMRLADEAFQSALNEQSDILQSLLGGDDGK